MMEELAPVTVQEPQPAPGLLDRSFLHLTRWDFEKTLWVIIIAVAFLTRVIGLGDRAMSHDESLHTVYSWKLFDGQGYQHQPMMHGPLKFILNAGSYYLFGVNDWSARIQVALFGVLMVAFVWLLRPWLGRVGALMVAAIYTISPALLYHSRYIRDEVILCSLLVLLVAGMFHYLKTRKEKWLLLVAATLALAFLTMEASFIFGGVFGIFLILVLFAQLWRSEWPVGDRRRSYRILIGAGVPALIVGIAVLMFKQRVPGMVAAGLGGALLLLGIALVILAWRKVLHVFAELDLIILFGTLVLPFASAIVLKVLGWEISQFNNPGQITLSAVWQGALVMLVLFIVSALIGWFWLGMRWVTAAAVFWAIALLFYTTFFTNGQGIGTGIIGSLGYWIDQQEVMRGGQPWYYFYMLVPLYEFLPLILSIGGIVYWLRTRVFGPRAMPEAPGTTEAISVAPGDAPYAPPISVQAIFEAFMVFWVLATWVVFTYVGEKMAWHTVYFATSMGLLGGWWLGKLITGVNWKTARTEGVVGLMAMVPLFLIALKAILPTSTRRPFGDMSLGGLSVTLQWALALIFGLVLLYFIYDRISALGWTQSLRAIMLSLVALLGVASVIVSYRFNFINYDYATEPMVYAHGTPDIKLALGQLEEISRKTAGDHQLRFAYDDDSTWPLEWYFRDYPNKVYYAANPSRDSMDAPVVFVGDKNLSKVRPYLGDRYQEFNYRLVWWPKEQYKGATIERILNGIKNPTTRGEFWDIVLRRRWTGSTAEWDPAHRFSMFVRKDVAAQVWDWGAPAASEAAAAGQPSAYEAGQRDIAAIQQLGVVGVAGAESGQFNLPRAVTTDGEGRIYVADSGNNRIQVFNPDGSFLRQWGSTCHLDTQEGCVDDGRGQFNEPWGIAVGLDGSVYVSDTWNGRIQKFDNQGAFVGMFGQFGATNGELGEPSFFYGPRSVVVGQNGNVFIVDTGNKRILELSPDLEFVNQYGGGGVTEGRFDEPVGLAQDGEGAWYVADTWNRRIQKFDAAFNYVTQWPIDGWSSQSVLNKPSLAVDPQRKIVYAVDPENYRVLAFDTDGKFLATWGLYGMDAQSFTMPTGISVAPDGRVVVADGDAHRIMIFPPLE